MKHIILSQNRTNEYTLVLRLKDNGEFTNSPFVVAWRYSYKTDSWAQGHYFQDLESAVMFMHFKEQSQNIYEMLKCKYESPFYEDELTGGNENEI